jgi:DNA-binding transcriptional LysR family regulator
MLDALTLDQMRMFLAVAEAGSFRGAAGRLSRVQSAVSHAIATMEGQLGIALFDRSGHRPALTREGRALLGDVRGILLKVDAFRARARGLGEGVELGLAIAVDTLFSPVTVGAALRDLHAVYPSVGVRMQVSALGGPIAAVTSGTCALAITAGEDLRDPRIALEQLTLVPMVAVAAANHALAAVAAEGRTIGTLELADHLQIVLEDPTPLTEGRDIGVLSPGTWRVSTQDAKHALIIAGAGWGRLPLWAVERDLAEGRLVRVPAAAWGPKGEAPVPAYLAQRTDAPLGPAARAFRQALLRRLRPAAEEG